MKAAYWTRLLRAERAMHAAIHARTLVMRDGTEILWSKRKYWKAFSDCLSRIDSPEARIILKAVNDDNKGKMLQLLHAVLNAE